MAEIKDISLDVKGTLSMFDPDSPTSIIKVVYQGTSPQFANYFTKNGAPRMVRAYAAVVNPGTPAQLARQQLMRLAVASWHSATETERQIAKPLAEKRQITLYMAYVSMHISGEILPVGIIWDVGSAVWDNLEVSAWDTFSATWEPGAEPWDVGSAVWDDTGINWDNLPIEAWDNSTTIWYS